MPAFAGARELPANQDVDGRDKPGHDDGWLHPVGRKRWLGPPQNSIAIIGNAVIRTRPSDPKADSRRRQARRTRRLRRSSSA